MVRCTQCGVWPVSPSDRFCGYCGAQVRGLEVHPVEPLYLDLMEARGPVLVELNNLGASSVSPKEIQSGNRWLHIAEDALSEEPMAPNEARTIEVVIDAERSTGSYDQEVEGTLWVFLQETSSWEPAVLELWPKPRLSLNQRDHDLDVSHTAFALPWPWVDLRVDRSHVRIREMVLKDEKGENWPASCRLQESQRGKWMTQGEQVRIEFSTDRSGTKHFHSVLDELREQSIWTFKGTLECTLEGRPEPERIPLTFAWIYRPGVDLDLVSKERGGLLEFRAKQGRRRTMELKAAARGDDLTVTDIQVTDAHNRQMPWIRLNNRLPLVLRKGKDRSDPFSFTVDGAGVAAADYRVRVHLSAKDRTKRSIPMQTFELTIRIPKRRPFPAPISVDFGMTNTCCAWWNEQTDEPELLELEPEYDSTEVRKDVMPSVVDYVGWDADGRPLYSTGRKADKQGRGLDVRSIKRKLGRADPLRLVREWEVGRQRGPQNLLPYKIAGDFLEHVLDRAEDALRKRLGGDDDWAIESCIVTHPTQFSMGQIADLRRAYETAGIQNDEEHLKMLDEGSAAALDVILKREERKAGQKDEYSLTVYDFGGGSIDMAACRVKVVPEAESTRIWVETVDADGDPEFGGEDVTDRIVRAMVEKVGGGDGRFPFPDESQASTRPDKWKDAAEANWLRVRFHAEALKKKLSTGAPDAESPPERLQEWKDDTEEAVISESMQFIITRDELEGFIRKDTETSVDKAISLASSPNLLVLSGQSSQLPIVEETFRKRWHDSSEVQIFKADDLKGCVGAGALYYIYNQEAGEGLTIDINNFFAKVPTNVGVVRMRGRTSKLRVVIKKGDRIPIKRSVPYKFQRTTLIRVGEAMGTERPKVIGTRTISFPELLDVELLQTNGYLEVEITESHQHRVYATISLPEGHPLLQSNNRFVDPDTRMYRQPVELERRV